MSATKPISYPSDPEEYRWLAMMASSLNDMILGRIRITNRLGAFKVNGPDDPLSSIVAEMKHAERQMALLMKKQMKKAAPNVDAWVKDTPGIGEHLMARLLGEIGHPVIARPHHWEGTGSNRVLVADPPFERNVAQLWAYCGIGDARRRRTKGISADAFFALGRPAAKSLLYLMALSCIKHSGNSGKTLKSGEAVVRARSAYRDVYEAGRARYAEREGWTDMHKHNAALRLVAKTILRDLWVVSREAMAE